MFMYPTKDFKSDMCRKGKYYSVCDFLSDLHFFSRKARMYVYTFNFQEKILMWYVLMREGFC